MSHLVQDHIAQGAVCFHARQIRGVKLHGAVIWQRRAVAKSIGTRFAEKPIDEMLVVHLGDARAITVRQATAVSVAPIGNAEELARRIE